jgi:hypothetical protein
MLDIKRHALDNRILEIVSGSYLYGTNTSTSDMDYTGIFTPPIDYLISLHKPQSEVNIDIHSKDDNGKNTSSAIDYKLYELRKFLLLALDNNPNILEVLFVNKESIKTITQYGQDLLNLKSYIASKKCIHKFIAYAHAQRHKMAIKAENFDSLHKARDLLASCDPKRVLVEIVTNTPQDNIFTQKTDSKYFYCGDICLGAGIFAKKALRIIEDRISKAGNRKQLLTKYGFDTKFGSHLIRLMYEGLMLVERQELIFPLPFASIILDIKEGKWEMQQVIELSEKLEDSVRTLESKSGLRTEPNFKAVNKYCINVLKETILNDTSIL